MQNNGRGEQKQWTPKIYDHTKMEYFSIYNHKCRNIGEKKKELFIILNIQNSV